MLNILTKVAERGSVRLQFHPWSAWLWPMLSVRMKITMTHIKTKGYWWKNEASRVAVDLLRARFAGWRDGFTEDVRDSVPGELT